MKLLFNSCGGKKKTKVRQEDEERINIDIANTPVAIIKHTSANKTHENKAGRRETCTKADYDEYTILAIAAVLAIMLFFILIVYYIDESSPDLPPTVTFDWSPNVYFNTSYGDFNEVQREMRTHIGHLEYAVNLPDALKENVTELFAYYNKEMMRRNQILKEATESYAAWMKLAISETPSEMSQFKGLTPKEQFWANVWRKLKKLLRIN